ncbi:hypothetical protein [Nocardioides sp. SYSU D00065]|uniref:hypothetical protein n=1 Tax=Nocardioides sp. SYSU D00065 TaxID=2817378 RepID=UPI001FEDDE66|nr:hypothetical protein [Nocardioides sp. SYSU D00065]
MTRWWSLPRLGRTSVLGRPVIRSLTSLLAFLLGSTLVLAVPATPAAQAARPGSLSISPGNGHFTAGQQVTLTGNLGADGRRRVRLQSNLGRSGDVWRDVPRATTRTNASGAFRLRIAAHSSTITYRVVSGSRRTSTLVSQAVHQEVTLRTQERPVAGRPLTLVASTAAMPLLPGRGLTFQQRVGTGWATLGTSTVGADGTGSLVVTPESAGTVVYRVRLEDWDRGVGHVGWFPSYPTYVDVAAADAARPGPPVVTSDRTARTRAATLARRAPHQSTAAGTLRWGVQRYDFDWEHGESLTDRAVIGTRRRGSWTDVSTGTGRVMLRNGAMQLSSNSEGAGRAGSLGSLSATLGGNAQSHGRWETRLMPMVFRGGTTDYVVRAELVPVADVATGCEARAITLYEARPQADGITIGARSSSGAAWQRTLPDVRVRNAFHALAVEVTPKRLTWFLDGRPIGRVTDPAAISGEPLTVRLSMQASGTEPMKTTRTLVDWVRAYPSGTGRPTRGGPRLTAGTHAVTC